MQTKVSQLLLADRSVDADQHPVAVSIFHIVVLSHNEGKKVTGHDWSAVKGH